MRNAILTILAIALLAGRAQAEPAAHLQAEAQALDIAKTSIAMRSVAGPGNQTAAVAALYRDALLAAGFAPEDIAIAPVDDTAYFMATWPGSDPALKPIVISGHMDVVEAKPADWQRDPFTPVVENGFLYGRGATDMKLDSALALAALIELRRSGYVPRRSIVVAFSGDEETTMKTSAILADKLKEAELVLNIDTGGGSLGEANGTPEYYVWTAAEKTYADFELSVTNPGGHSSEPRRANAINQLAAGLFRIANHQFKPELDEVTRASLIEMARYEAPAIGQAMRAFVADPTDRAAIATLTDNPATVGKIGTTCIATTIGGGHAYNALPQRVSATINCRIFPGHSPAEIMAELQRVAAEPGIVFTDITVGSVASAASPLRADFVAAVTDAIHAVYPGVPVFPAMASGASDNMWYRHVGVPSYSASPMFMKRSDDFSHGLNERTPIANVRPAITYYLSLLPALTR